MKIFGKKKASTVSQPDADDPGKVNGNHPESSSSTENVPSYFSSNFFQSKPSSSLSSPSSTKDNAPNIQELMSKDPSTLTSKERRILRRFQQRQNGSSDDKEPPTLEYASTSTTAAETPKSKSTEDPGHGLVDSSSLQNNLEQPNLDTSNLVQQLQGFNSKERRQLLRSWKQQQQQSQSASSFSTEAESLDKAIQWMKEEAKKMGFENREEKMQNEMKGIPVEVEEEDSGHVNKKKRKTILEESKDPTDNHDQNVSKKMRPMETTRTRVGEEEQDTTTNGKGAPVKKDWSHLTPEERQRREVQRQMQKEAEERRRKALLENGQGTLSSSSSSLFLSGKHKHPLNSERRRANKRKPSGKIAKMLFKKRERA
jgi:hypothetical protein